MARTGFWHPCPCCDSIHEETGPGSSSLAGLLSVSVHPPRLSEVGGCTFSARCTAFIIVLMPGSTNSLAPESPGHGWRR